jgi:hypothetical protein
VSSSAITVPAVVVAVVAMLTLLALDRRKPVRRHAVTPRAPGGRAPALRPVQQQAAVTYRRTPLWRRALAVVGLGGMSVVLGVLLAIVAGAVLVGLFLAVTDAVQQ